MEGGGGGGERKRKAADSGGPLDLDWNKLLDDGAQTDDVPPPLLVIEDSKPDGDVDRPYAKLRDKELRDTIARMRDTSPHLTAVLPDNGEKFLACLRKYEAELELRTRLKADGKCKKATPLDADSSCNGPTHDVSPGRASLSAPATLASHFCRKLDEKKDSKSFKEELSTLDRRDHKSTGENSLFPAQRTENMCISSRQKPFRSPSLISVNTDNSPQSNDKQSGGRSSTPSPHLPDEVVPGCSTKMENAPRLQPTHNTRRNNQKTVVLVDEEELDDDVPNQAHKMEQSKREAQIFYPSRDDPDAIEICYSDIECLDPESYLSSTIMNFYIRYLLKPSPTSRKTCDYHCFNTYFYKKLKQDVLNKIDREASFVKFRRWWKGVNIFEKAYIFLPIHENLHWSLVIICMPNNEDHSGPLILHLDSLGLHISKSIFSDVKSFLVEEWKFLGQEEKMPEPPIAGNIWHKLSRRIDEKVIEVPQQENEYDCGLFVLFFMERFISEAAERLKKNDLDRFGRQWFRPEEASSLRQKIRDLLKEEFKYVNEDTCKLDN